MKIGGVHLAVGVLVIVSLLLFLSIGVGDDSASVAGQRLFLGEKKVDDDQPQRNQKEPAVPVKQPQRVKKVALAWADRDAVATATGAPSKKSEQQPKPARSAIMLTEKILLVSAVQRPSVLCPLLQGIRRSGFSGKMVLLHRPDAASAKVIEAMVHDKGSAHFCSSLLSSSSSSLSSVELFSSPSVPMRSPTYYPLIAAGRYMDQKVLSEDQSADSSMIIYIDPMEVSWCGDLFAAVHSSNVEDEIGANAVYAAFSSDWGYHSKQEASAPGPYVLAGYKRMMKTLLPALSRMLVQMAIERSESRSSIGKVFLDRFNKKNFPQQLEQLLPFPSPVVMAANEKSCSTVGFLPDQCLNKSVVMIVDKRICARDGHDDALKGFCTTSYAHDVYSLPMEFDSSRVALIGDQQIVSNLKSLREKPEHRNLSEIPYDPRDEKFAACPRGRPNALVGMASGYRAEDIKGFILSFFAFADTACTDLVLFVKSIPEGVDETHRAMIHWELIPEYSVEVRKNCPAVETRCEIYRLWLLRTGSFKYGMIFLTDVRDVFLQADPFKELFKPGSRLLMHMKGTRSAAALSDSDLINEEFLYIPPESYLTSTWSDFVFWPHVMFQNWMDGIFGAAYRREIQHGTLQEATATLNGEKVPRNEGARGGEIAEPLPIICSGLYMGTSRALLQALDMMLEVFRATPCWFGADQAILTGMVYDGFRLGGFQHQIYLANPEFSFFHNGIQRHHDVLWREGQFVNCDGMPYSIVHQVDAGRHPWMWPHVMARAGGCDGPLAVKRPDRRLVEQTTNPHILPAAPQNSKSLPTCTKSTRKDAPPTLAVTPNDDAKDLILVHGNHWGIPYLGPTLKSIRHAAGCKTAPIVVLAPHEQSFRELSADPHFDQFRPLSVELYNSTCLRSDQGFFHAALRYLQKLDKRGPKIGFPSFPERVALISASMNVRWNSNIFNWVEIGKVYLTRGPSYSDDVGSLAMLFDRCGLAPIGGADKKKVQVDRFGSFADEFVIGDGKAVLALLEFLIDFGAYSRCSTADALNTMMHRHGAPSFVDVWTSEEGPVVSFKGLDCDKDRLPRPTPLCEMDDTTSSNVITPAVMIHPCKHF